MPVPTEVLNDDIKELKAEVRDVRADISIIKSDIHRIDVGLAEIRTQLKDLIGVATWGVKLAVGSLVTIVGTIIAGAAGASWWASNITAEVRNLSGQVADLKAGLEAGRRIPTNFVVPPGVEIPKPEAMPLPEPGKGAKP